MRRTLVISLFISMQMLIAMGCREKAKGPDPLMPDLDETDSVEVLFFRAPDSVRYFTYLSTTDKDLINDIRSNLKQDTVAPITCMKEGKIYLFKKGQIFNTVFFGYLDKECRFLRYIKNGNMFYYQLSPGLEKKLASYKTEAKEPVAADVK